MHAPGVSTAAERPGAAAGSEPGCVGRGGTAPREKFRTCNRSKDGDNRGQVLPPRLENMQPSLRRHRAWKAFKPHSSYKIHKAEPSAWQPALQLPSLGCIFPAVCECQEHEAASASQLPKVGQKRGRNGNGSSEPSRRRGGGGTATVLVVVGFNVPPPLINASH